MNISHRDEFLTKNYDKINESIDMKHDNKTHVQ